MKYSTDAKELEKQLREQTVLKKHKWQLGYECVYSDNIIVGLDEITIKAEPFMYVTGDFYNLYDWLERCIIDPECLTHATLKVELHYDEDGKRVCGACSTWSAHNCRFIRRNYKNMSEPTGSCIYDGGEYLRSNGEHFYPHANCPLKGE